MNNKIFLLIIALCSGLTLTACDSGGGQSSSQDGGGGGGDQGGGDEGGGDEGGGDEGGGDEGGGDEGGGDEGGGDEGGGDEGGGDEGGGDEGGGDEGGGDEGGGDEGGGDEGGGDEGGGDEGGDPQVPPHLKPCSVGTFANAVSALKNRDASKASEAELIAYAQCVLDLEIKNPVRQQAVSMTYQGLGETYTWQPGGYSQFFNGMSETTFSLLGVNNTDYSLAMAGEQQGQRHIALAQNPLLRGKTETSELWLKNMVSWLTQKASSNRSSYRLAGQSDNKLHVVIANMKGKPDYTGSYAQYDAMKSWLDSTYPEAYTINANGTCDDEKLLACLNAQPADLLIVGDKDVNSLGYDGIKSGMDYARQNKISLMAIPSNPDVTPLLQGMYQNMHILANKNTSGTYKAIDFPVANLMKPSASAVSQSAILSSLSKGEFSASVFDPDEKGNQCKSSVLNCSLPAFKAAFRDGADVWRYSLNSLDISNFDVLTAPGNYPVLAASVLLADKYRQNIDYPVSADEEGLFLQGLFADWVVDYSRPDNIAQPDLGEYAVKSNQVVKGSLASSTPQAPVSEQRTFTVPFTKQATTSGWYAPAGKAVTVSSSKESAAVVIQLGFGYTDVYQSAGNRKLVAPSEASLKDMPRITLAPGESRTFSTPYGGPIFIRFVDDTLTHATLNADGVTPYAAITDINDATNITAFEQEIENGDTPWVDIKLDGIEVHALKFRFTDGLTSKSNVEAGITTTGKMLEALKNYYTWNHTLAGLKVVGKTLAQSLPADELKVCNGLWGETDCNDEKLHTRPIIQHINYDQRSRCVGGSGCSGNPFDTSWQISPYGWGESHEQGHNLQRAQLEVNYVDAADKENWTNYKERSGESSNNIFSYYVLWKSTYGLNREGPFSAARGNPRDIYAVMMSDLRGLKDGSGNPVIYDASCKAFPVEGVVASRYTAPWQIGNASPSQQYRDGFYFQMAFHADKQVMRGGTTLANGFNIYTLLYQHGRIFDKYAGNASDWNAHRDSLGFSNFAWNGDATYGGKSVKGIPGNDFLLVSLSYITNADWRPYFDMYGLHYTELARKQVEVNGFDRTIEQKIFTNKDNPNNLPGKDLTGDADFVTIDMTDKSAEFPGKPWTCK